MSDLLTLVRSYYDAIEQGDEACTMELLHPDVVHRELPNRLTPKGW